MAFYVDFLEVFRSPEIFNIAEKQFGKFNMNFTYVNSSIIFMQHYVVLI